MKLSFQVLVMTVGASLALAGSKTSRDLPTNPNLSVDVLVQYKNPPTKDELKQLGPYGQIKKLFSHVNAAQVSLTWTQIQALVASDPNIVYISPNRPTKGALDITTASVNANLAWTLGYDGTGVGVAVIDSGIAQLDDVKTANGLSSRVVYSESFVAGLDGSDQYGHGTHVAGIVGSNAKDSTGLGFTRSFKGVAPNVNLINLRVLDANGNGTDSGVIAAIERAIALKSTYNIRVINLSLGRAAFESYTLDPLCQAVEAAWQAGIVVVAAAGNYGRAGSTHGYGTITSPGNDPYVITVGALNAMATKSAADDKIASYSSKGPTAIDHLVKPDLVAPGNNVVSLLAPGSTLATNYPQMLVSNATYETPGTPGSSKNYLRLSGTSMATPVVAGAAALLIQKNPALTPDQVKARLMKTARKAVPLFSTAFDMFTKIGFPNQSDIFAVGAGELDVQAALASNDLTTHPALSPQAVYNSATRRVTIMRDLSLIWGDSLIWDDSLVWGNFVFNGSVNGASLIWGDSADWGDTTLTGFSLIWGDGFLDDGSIQPLDTGDYDDDTQ